MKVYLYGFAGTSEAYRLIRYEAVDLGHSLVNDIKYVVQNMLDNFPAIESIFMCDPSYVVIEACRHAKRTKLMEDSVILKATLEQVGIQVM